ncbi:TDP-N-acetylfucosamine:lipid II N-acetylfucosaminyltransferase [Marinobacterium sp. AK62]|uniref:TDP-N-acetylfucosamine:lipid II N-acetylfucosaminyltransferase n=1 Tax=Marinobacterium alkalitolerans TaxID=1542925 RepID=A0ABS3Z8R5_9GAMM|nr:TDP-N-acetylfucosamine:lipid II N-acetylfucosaminyltransferase [Marinobacterium alkalitolerans]MBP0048093.1 TDP-N-acetylfucosamine:lipid II N-acetylfucosaminyltransferase [Marinobacterium alkalitolerans]
MSKKILHVCNADNFIPPFIDFIEKQFGLDGHFFWINGDFDFYPVKQHKSAYKVKKSITGQMIGFVKLIYLLNTSSKVILHGIFNPRVILILFLMPWLLKKCYWVMWGGDLYVYQLGEKNWKWKVKEFLRRPVIKNMGHLVTYIPGDVELARQWYGAKGEYHECLMYISNVVDPDMIQEAQAGSEEHLGINILVGNSADPSNNHIESLEKLLPYKEDEIKIFVPLSYGNHEYAKKVIETGKAWFGENFVPITSFMEFDEYLKFLKTIDIAIFNHNRQQAMGNTITLLGMGRTVYLRSDVSQWFFFEDKGIKCLDFNLFNKKFILSKDAKSNSKICLNYFNIIMLRHQYSEIFK